MKLLHAFLLALLCAYPVLSLAQWQWLDKDGRKVYSDRAPPPDIAEKDIQKQPTGAQRPSAAGRTSPEALAAVAPPKALGKDAALEAKKKQADDEEETKRRQSADKSNRDLAQNCERARSTLTVLKSGIRMKAPNAAGEVVFINDADRSAEIERVQAIVASDCK